MSGVKGPTVNTLKLISSARVRAQRIPCCKPPRWNHTMTITLSKCASVYADQEIDHLSVVIQSIVGQADNSLSASAIGYWTQRLHQISLRYTLLMVQIRRIKALLELITR